jgi:L-rhamnose mutarotase
MQRMGMVIGIAPEHIAEYKRLHAAVWPAVLARLAASNIRNYSIFHGSDYEADMAAIAADPETRRWWTFCSPCQRPLPSRGAGEHWAPMECVFHVD